MLRTTNADVAANRSIGYACWERIQFVAKPDQIDFPDYVAQRQAMAEASSSSGRQ
jgi:hypothetical protein